MFEPKGKEMKKVVEGIKFWVPIIVMVGAMMYGCKMAVDARHDHMVKYAAEHNCRWDYNDMCYTREERPWLFRDKTDD